MNIDQQLRAVLGQEAEMQNAPAPDVDRLISGGRNRQRRGRMARVGVAAAIAVLVAGGVYGVTKTDPGAAFEPAQSPSTMTPQAYRADGAPVEPGTYQMLVGVDSTDAAINADLTFNDIWQGQNYPVFADETAIHGGVAVFQPLALAAGTGCLSDKPNARVAQTPQGLAQQLAQLPRSTVVQSPTPVQAFGRPAIHLRLRINQRCTGANDYYRVADTLRGNHGITYGDILRPVLIDFWVQDVGGAPMVVDSWHEIDASSQTVDEINRTRDSIAFDGGG
jgi:hypothetical protein